MPRCFTLCEWPTKKKMETVMEHPRPPDFGAIPAVPTGGMGSNDKYSLATRTAGSKVGKVKRWVQMGDGAGVGEREGPLAETRGMQAWCSWVSGSPGQSEGVRVGDRGRRP